jgi:uncharacterized membrane protein
MFHSTIGLVHLVAALLAMVAGAVVLLNTKAGTFHKRAGYVYVACMLVLNATAFQLFHLFGRFGPFHWLALVSLASLLGGMLPVLFRRYVSGWMYWHYYFMNWSVVGLYVAFWAETLTRTLPMGHFWGVVVAATGLTAAIGSFLIRRHAARLLPPMGV